MVASQVALRYCSNMISEESRHVVISAREKKKKKKTSQKITTVSDIKRLLLITKSISHVNDFSAFLCM